MQLIIDATANHPASASLCCCRFIQQFPFKKAAFGNTPLREHGCYEQGGPLPPPVRRQARVRGPGLLLQS